MMISEEYKKIILKHYERTVLKTNMVKTSTSSTLIAAGLIIIQNGIASTHLNPLLVGLGVCAVVLGFVVNYAGDVHKVEQKKEEIDLIDEAIRESSRRVLANIREDIADHLTQEIEAQVYKSLEKRLREKR